MEIYPPWVITKRHLIHGQRGPFLSAEEGKQAQYMGLTVRAATDWNPESAAFCGGLLGAVAVLLHEGYTVLVGLCLPIDPFTHVMAELAVFAPVGAAVLGMAANVRNRLVR